MWTVVYLAPNKREAERIKKLLAEDGALLVKLRPVGAEGNCQAYEVLVPEAEVEEALELLGLR
ncbi:glutamate decarboxylase [Ammonifex thiophilus]|uniref:Glutamate decarboxylase n=1 Tax=Ammonifex thiophilus TaxID=444093 RepID=A0A3D8P4B2_9THEO|nr:glutamate decarboxylase [Ammonifex thiophilus]RDV82098.1 glutamate decarboxylase [Ammonifex thiophilus]